jgi:hypothetical protein
MTNGIRSPANIVNFVVLLTLGLGLGVGFWSLQSRPEIGNEPAVQAAIDQIKVRYPRLSVEALPLGANEALGARAEQILGFSHYRFIRVRSKIREVDVYIAWWLPRVRTVGLVRTHTPDVCWVQNGAERLQREFREFKLGPERTVPGEWQLYRVREGRQVEVVYWHLVGDRSVTNRSASFWAWWESALTELMYREQVEYFVRVSSLQRLEDAFMDNELSAFLIEILDVLSLIRGTSSNISPSD